MQCDFEKTGRQDMRGDGRIFREMRCKRCGRIAFSRSSPERTHATCRALPAKKAKRRCNGGGPGWAQRGFNFLNAMTLWAGGGFQRTTEAEYLERQRLCEACDLLSSTYRCTHKKCGCPVARKASVIVEPGRSDCPLGTWPALRVLPAEPAEDQPGS